VQSAKQKKTSDCLAIVGTEAGCGKTVLISGMAGALREQGFKTRAMKPIVLGPKSNAEPELNFISSVSHTPRGYQQIFVEKSTLLRDTSWHNAISQNRDSESLTLLELPGGSATPICFDENPGQSKVVEWQDTTDILAKSNLPCIIVAKHAADAIEQLVLSAYYLTMKRVFVLGLATVETSAGIGQEMEDRITRDDFAMALFSRTGAPYLGCIKYSPSVSVPRCNQGNLIKLTTAGLDLLTVMKALNLTVSV
jgi:dethiobiotin synthetase